ncbi:Trm112p-domain-containing protein [Nadsonia fulvescens var. elongata DSM 6958]|uniref:Multifunctional methyltransferase subunit trm112 n=1 Tax=Nadsonia fulvescens var. elongata DSM 6958 TaxID=857566 RepID=A0A1E3PHW2_9ASCO|nr:Trm112p-domain-containing protein [Nadsonia fulvescens var. elongata DSM 6958]
MKFLTTNFVQCAVKSCASSGKAFPLEYKELEMIQQEVDYDPAFIAGILVRIDWDALVKVAKELGNNALPDVKPELENIYSEESDVILRSLHSLLLETQINEGKMVCRNCGHIYYIKNSIPNFLLPPHLA